MMISRSCVSASRWPHATYGSTHSSTRLPSELMSRVPGGTNRLEEVPGVTATENSAVWLT